MDTALEVRVRASAYLPKSSQSRLHALPRIVLEVRKISVIEVIEVVWPRSDQAHVALEHVVDLRQLVEAEPTQPFPYPRHTWIVRNLDHSVRVIEVGKLLHPLFGCTYHGLELVH